MITHPLYLFPLFQLLEDGHLSVRMRIPGNIWLETWHTAQPSPARRQKRLFDYTKEAEKVVASKFHLFNRRTVFDRCETSEKQEKTETQWKT